MLEDCREASTQSAEVQTSKEESLNLQNSCTIYKRAQPIKPIGTNPILFDKPVPSEKHESEYRNSFKWRGWKLQQKPDTPDSKPRPDHLKSSAFPPEDSNDKISSIYRQSFVWHGTEKPNKFEDVVNRALNTDPIEDFRQVAIAEKKERDLIKVKSKKTNQESSIFPKPDEISAHERKKLSYESSIFGSEEGYKTPKTIYQKAFNWQKEEKDQYDILVQSCKCEQPQENEKKEKLPQSDVYEKLVQERIAAAKNNQKAGEKSTKKIKALSSVRPQTAVSAQRQVRFQTVSSRSQTPAVKTRKNQFSRNDRKSVGSRSTNPAFYNNPRSIPNSEKDDMVGPVWFYWPKGKPLPAQYKELAHLIQ